jgi:hypothetical protein
MLEFIKKIRKMDKFRAFDEQKGVFSFIFLFFIISLIIAFTFDGTGDAGDAIAHYHFARFAFAHPEHFFNHWAKPFFVLLASPFAQFGFVGIKIFNIICVTISLVFTYKIAQKLNFPHAWFAPFILATCSGYFTLMFSGLTEFLCAAMLSVTFYQYISNKNWHWATILVSFLPFVRSEGLLIIGVVSMFLIVKKRWSLLPLLTIGHIVYAFAGYVVHKDLGWVFNKMTYATLNAYGSGSLFHFVDKLYYLTGLPHFIFWIIGTLAFVVGILRGSLGRQVFEITLLIFGSFFTFLIAHSLFWYLGIFMSFGLSRVMNAVMPFFALIALYGFNFLIHSIKNIKVQKIVNQLIIFYFVVFQAIPQPSSINWKKDLSLDEGQVFAQQAALFLSEKYPNYTYFYLHPQIPLALNMDNFDKKKFRDFSGIRDSTNLTNNAIFIWDNLFCVLDAGIHFEEVMKNSKLEVIKSYETINKSHHLVILKVK